MAKKRTAPHNPLDQPIDAGPLTDRSGAPIKLSQGPRVPWLGDTVYFHNPRGGQVQAAITTHVDRPGDPASPLDLHVFTHPGTDDVFNVPHGSGEFGFWDWAPER